MQNQLSNSAKVNLSNVIGCFQIAVGGFLAVSFGIFFLAFLFDGTEASTNFVVFSVAVLFGWMLRSGLKRCKVVKVFNSYLPYITVNGVTSFQNIATCVGQSPEDVRKYIALIYRKGYFRNVLVHMGDGVLISKEHGSAYGNVPATPYASKAQFTTQACPGCGAVNKVEAGKVSECEFCGSKIN